MFVGGVFHVCPKGLCEGDGAVLSLLGGNGRWVGMVPIRHFLGERLNHQMKKKLVPAKFANYMVYPSKVCCMII